MFTNRHVVTSQRTWILFALLFIHQQIIRTAAECCGAVASTWRDLRLPQRYWWFIHSAMWHYVAVCLSTFRPDQNIFPLFQYISNKVQHYTVYLYPKTALHVSGGTSTHHQKRIQLYLQHLVFVRPLPLPAAIATGSSNGVTNTRYCRYSCMRFRWWVEVPPETCRAVFGYK